MVAPELILVHSALSSSPYPPVFARFWIPTAVWLAFLPLSVHFDLLVAHHQHRAYAGHRLVWVQSLYEFGAWPALIVGLFALIPFFPNRFVESLRPLRRIALLYLSVFVLGTGIMTHWVLKELWSRPRPCQVVEFGGGERFRPVYLPNGPSSRPLRSFPSGHVGCGVCFFALERAGAREGYPLLRAAGLLTAIIYGGGLAFARIVQEGHFLSDTLGTAYVLWCVCLVAEWVIYGREPNAKRR